MQAPGVRPVALVTGAARGIGAAAAVRLARDGWRLVLVDACHDDPALGYPLARTAELQEVVERCGRGAALSAVADVRDPGALASACELARRTFGGLDAAVSVAGAIVGGSPVWKETPDAYQTMIDVNLTGVWNLARAALPVMLERPSPRSGRFVVVASAAGLVGMPRLGAYVAAKHGGVGLVKALAADLGPEGITANAVCPGSTRGPMLDASAAIYGLGSAEELAVHQLDFRLLEPEEPAALVAWLCSRESSAINGAALAADGGLSAH